ncbi:probable root meristem growth factor 8 [Chenopodium quinoa]|uniref:probable root meristem growth factor 8 n=1 Tax=Chenopodium quinoa TaxID=63459 RepID=UPI000B77A9AB|nr:probable root meristem growth factor 8 [Chenopodium quinoa]
MNNKLVLKITIFLCFFYSLLLKPCTSFQLHGVHPSFTSLPRKLNAVEKVTKTSKHVESHMKAKNEILGELQKKDVNMMQITGDKWREWEEVHDPTELFTMDYRRVRRRRPIHNKSLHP